MNLFEQYELYRDIRLNGHTRWRIWRRLSWRQKLNPMCALRIWFLDRARK
jgi:hypothetical protein